MNDLNTSERSTCMQVWLSEALSKLFSEEYFGKGSSSKYQIEPMVGDASPRRYFRIRFQQTNSSSESSFILMDDNPKTGNVAVFVAIAEQLQQAGITTPKIVAKNEHFGFLLLSDFGVAENRFLELMQKNSKSLAVQLMHNAITT